MQDWPFKCHLWAYFKESYTKKMRDQSRGNSGTLYSNPREQVKYKQSTERFGNEAGNEER